MPRSVPTAAALILAIVLAGGQPAAAVGANPTPGPINAHVVSVYDGDTMTVDAEPWPDVTIRTKIRVAGVDAPEILGKCQAEKDLALRARDFVRTMMDVGDPGREHQPFQVQLTNIRPGKYAGRVIADVWVDGQKLADLLIAENLGRPYHGGRREGWCL